MAIGQGVENGVSKVEAEIKQPFIYKTSKGDEESSNRGSIAVVLLSTFVAVLGSYTFGSCVCYLISLLSTHLVLHKLFKIKLKISLHR